MENIRFTKKLARKGFFIYMLSTMILFLYGLADYKSDVSIVELIAYSFSLTFIATALIFFVVRFILIIAEIYSDLPED